MGLFFSARAQHALTSHTDTYLSFANAEQQRIEAEAGAEALEDKA